MTEKHPHIYKCLGKVINERRKKLGMSQEELAEQSGIDRAFISNVERGKRSPSFRSVAHLARGLKIKYSRLVHRCEECEKDLEERSKSA